MTLNNMNENRWKILTSLDQELLKGGVVLSEWCSFIVQEADAAFVGGAHLATILTAVSGIETFLRSEASFSAGARLVELIDRSSFAEELKEDLHELRRYRNKWVHVDTPCDDRAILENLNEFERELERMAFFAIRTLRRTIYLSQSV